MITFFFSSGRRAELPDAAVVTAEAFEAALSCYDAASRPVGRFLVGEVIGYAADLPRRADGLPGRFEWDSSDYRQIPPFDNG